MANVTEWVLAKAPPQDWKSPLALLLCALVSQRLPLPLCKTGDTSMFFSYNLYWLRLCKKVH